MKPRRVWAVARKEFLHVLRDPRSLGMAIAIPMLMLVLFGFALTVDVDNVPVVVWDQCGSVSSREFTARFDGSPYFSVVGSVDGYGAIEAALDRREAIVALVIPIEFSREIEQGRTAQVQLIVDGSDSNTATIAIGYAEAIARIYGMETAVRELRRQGLPPIRRPLDVRQRVWFNADMESRNYIIPGLIAVIMMIIAAMLTSLTVAREWERGTMEQLISTPVKGPELIVGKLVPYFVLGSVDVLLAVLMGEFVFGVPLRGSAALVFALGAVFLAGALSMGMLISIVARNQLLASQMAMTTTFLPAFLLSGFMIPIANMPAFIQAVTYVVPARYFVAILHAIYLKGVGLEIVGMEAALLALFGTITVLAANLKFRKRLV
jgi:ABC-2 type transport system permease protein